MRAPRGAQRGPELSEGLNDSRKAKGIKKKAKGHPSDFGGELLGEIIAKVSKFPSTMVSLGS